MGTNTGIGIGIGIPFKNNALGGDKPYFPPELKARMIGVWTNYGKKNTDADRNIIKNKIPNAGGDLEILNAAYKLNSGFGEYSEDFTTWTKSSKITSVDSESFDFVTNVTWNLLYYKSNIGKDIPSFKVRIKLKGEGKVYYNYITSEGVYTNEAITSEEYITPISYNTKYTGETPVNCGFTIGISNECSGTITQIPNFEDAFVTDGVNDLIISQKTVKEMIGDNDEITVISMVYYINTDVPARISITNDVRGMTAEDKSSQVFARNEVKIEGVGKLGIYGWSKKGASTTVYPYFNILGDKTDYGFSANYGLTDDAKFCPVGEPSLRFMSKQAHYWSFMVIGKLTEDEINLIIGNYNLDRSLKPDILCNIGKQGITNENHAEFNDKLIDYSGNGRDIQMNNLAWKGGSGIAAKPFETIKDYTIVSDEARQKLTIYNEFSYKIKSNTPSYYWTVQSIIRDNTSYQVTIITDKDCYWINATSFINSEGNKESIRKKYPVLANTPTQVIICGLDQFEYPEGIEPTSAVSYVNLEYAGEITVTFIPSYKGGILLDGINDFGQFVGDLRLKDYTFIADRAYDRIVLEQVPFIASTQTNGQAPFLMEYLNGDTYVYPHSFGTITKTTNLNIQRQISYQSTYVYNGNSISKGASVDTGDGLTIGNSGSTGLQYSPLYLWSLMLFPYSMSEFLIERQLKKHKLGTLYPNMVEFRPVIKSSVELVNKPTFAIRYTSTLLNAGDYIPENSEIWVVITMNNAADRITKFVINGNTIDIPSSAYNPSTMKYGFPFTIDSKSPQKITMTIEQDENYVQWNPVVTSNVEYNKLDFYLNNYQKIINVGDYIPKDAYLRANIYLNNNVDELAEFTFNGVNIGYRRSSVDDTAFNIGQIYNYDSPQEVNITIDEYIRYEDIVQPYPVLLRFNDENGNEVSWRGKFRVGSTITRIGSISNPESNLLNGLYSVSGLSLNGKAVTSSTSIVEKQMVFRTTATWLLDNNEPKAILSPRLLSIPNSSYKILGYIPDISGHGNNGVIHNSAYAQMSGANGYGTNLGNWSINSANTGKIITQREEHLEYEVLSADKNILFYNTKIENDTFVIYTSVNTNIVYSKESDIIANIPANTPTKVVCPKIGTILLKTNETPTVGNIITVKQYGIYEGAYCFDGVNDFVTIPTTVGGKQVLMKVNWQSIAGTAILYDQRTNGGFAIFNKDFDTNENKVPAYRARNIGGSTYIDGILNEYIYASELKDITHNIVELCDPELNTGTLNPQIGSSFLNASYTQMSLYDFMLFDEISTDDKIKELNEYVGVEAKVELPPYYWDTYGKTNLDADKATIQQRGVAIGDYDLTNYNHAYEGMSGYNGYPVVFGANKTWESLSGVYGYTSDVTNTTIHVTHAEHAGNGLLFSYVKKDGALANIKEIPAFRVTIGGLEGNSKFGYRYLATEDATEETLVYLGNGTHELAKSFAPTEALLDLTRNVWVGIFITPMVEGEVVFDCDITIEVLPEYENGLAYDGITDYSKNANIPVFTDYTYIYKRTIINIPTNAATLLKGADKTNGGAFIADYGNKWQFNFGQYNTIQGIADGINWQTVNSFNGTSINKGENTDDSGITVAKFSNGYTSMVFYKLILYPKTISLLEINFLKNLMEKDEIIDLNNPIFIKNE